jgi:hypothetical protein
MALDISQRGSARLDGQWGGLEQPRHWSEFSLSDLGPEHSLYFYVGSGLSTAAGLVGWTEMACMIWWYLTDRGDPTPGPCPENGGRENEKFLAAFMGLRDDDGHKLLSHESAKALDRTVLLNLILRYREPSMKYITHGGTAQKRTPERPRTRCGREPDPEDLVLQSLIWRTGCHGVLTSNYDMLLEHAYSAFSHGSALRSYRYDASFLRYIMSNRRFVLKLHGDINDIGTMQLNPEDFWIKKGKIYERYRKDLTTVYRDTLKQGHMVYVGAGFRDSTIIYLHEHWRDEQSVSDGSESPTGSPKFRVALVPDWELDTMKGEIQAKTEGFRKRGEDVSEKAFDDVKFLTYREREYDALPDLLSRIIDARGNDHRSTWRPSQEAHDIYKRMFFDKD